MSGADWYPGAVRRPLPEDAAQASIRPRQFIAHSAVGAGSLFGYFVRSSVALESHLWVSKAVLSRVEQYVRATRRADANYLSNPWAISVETADNGDPDTDPWDAFQIEQLARLAVWAHREHGIPLELAPRWDAPGMGWHSMFPGRWTNVRGKTCAGQVRNRQFRDVVLPRARDIARTGTTTPPPTPAPEDDDMEQLIRHGSAYLLQSGLTAWVIPDPDSLAEVRRFLHRKYGAARGWATVADVPVIDGLSDRLVSTLLAGPAALQTAAIRAQLAVVEARVAALTGDDGGGSVDMQAVATAAAQAAVDELGRRLSGSDQSR